jgi:hypothetical protein
MIPLFSATLAQSLSAGRFSSLALTTVTRTECFYVALPIVVIFLARRSWAGLLLTLCVASAGIYLKAVEYPVLDQQVSARGLWREMREVSGNTCDGGMNRDWTFGLAFYRGAPYPACGQGKFEFALRTVGHGPPVLQALK